MKNSSRIKLFYGPSMSTIEETVNSWLTANDSTWNTVHTLSFIETKDGFVVMAYYTPEKTEEDI